MQETLRLVGLKADLDECKCNEFRKVLETEINRIEASSKLSHKTNIGKIQAGKEIAI